MSFYRCCAEMLDKALQHRASVKSLVLSSKSPHDKRSLMAILCRVLEYRAVLEELIDKSNILEMERKQRITRPLAMVLLYDFLLGKGMRRHPRSGSSSPNINNNSGGGGHYGPYLAVMMRHKTRLNAELARIKVRHGVQSNKALIPHSVQEINKIASRIPRYIRVNLITTTTTTTTKSTAKDQPAVAAAVSAVLQQLQADDYNDGAFLHILPEPPVILPPPLSPASSKHRQSSLVWRDPHLPDLIAVWPPSVDFHQHPLYTGGRLILQDKASCMPAHALNPPAGATVIDACAAPGNKTSHLASLMGNTGKIYAFDLDERRLNTLRRLTARAGCTNIQSECKSFLDLDPAAYEDVEYILLDPSCSGSGIVNRMDHLIDTNQQTGDETAIEDDERLKSLAQFQTTALLHAMRFPSVRRVVYSTCSVHRVENEEVVAAVVNTDSGSSNNSDGGGGGDGNWRLIKTLPQWTRRGVACDGLSEQQSDCLIRCDPSVDYTNGFFVACFERID